MNFWHYRNRTFIVKKVTTPNNKRKVWEAYLAFTFNFHN